MDTTTIDTINSNLIEIIEKFQINENNIPIEVIQAYSKLRSKIHGINRIKQPVFTENGKETDMKYWNDWKFTGMNNWEFIDTGFYKEGFCYE